MEKQKFYQDCITILRAELKPALGCTEPIAVAYAAARAREVLGTMPTQMEVCCSGNIIKNVKGVNVPHADGMKGIEVAALLGTLVGDASKELEVLEYVMQEHIARMKELLGSGVCKCTLRENVANLYIDITMRSGSQSAEVEVKDTHTNITRIVHNGEVLLNKENDAAQEWNLGALKKSLTLEKILDFAKNVDLAGVKELLDQQIRLNSAISAEGLQNKYGANIGQMLLERGQDVRILARAKSAAGSDARMNGCPLPVVINSGSGNQGITACMPVLTYAERLHADSEQIYRALLISNLVAIYQKTFIGSLSAFCGAVCAAAGSGAAITYLQGGTDEQIGNTIINTLANIGGMVCDGAKSSCAAKIASAVEAAILGSEMSLQNKRFQSGDGIVKENAEQTIQSVGRMARVGMKGTDIEILNIMLEN